MTDWFDLNQNEERAVAAFMSRVANLRVPGGEPRTAAAKASELWSKARLIERWEAERKAQRPLDIMQPIEIAGGLMAAGVLLYLTLLR